ncbi:MAG: transposase family protein [Candidatus Saccharicenans sp.]|nr:transposase family protein [Candidatus Saccharicenans sp.]
MPKLHPDTSLLSINSISQRGPPPQGGQYKALESGCPEYFNTDQGAQFTSSEFLSILQRKEIKISMDGKGRVIDNIFIESFWRTLKYEKVYTKCYETVAECRASMGSLSVNTMK